jgi:hypothetical protein
MIVGLIGANHAVLAGAGCMPQSTMLGRRRPATPDSLDRILTRVAKDNLVPVTLRSAFGHAEIH